MIDVSTVEEIYADYHFVTGVYRSKREDLLPTVTQVFKDSVNEIKKDIKLDEIYPVIQTREMLTDPRMEKFIYYICEKSWHILDSQGVDMSKYITTITELWGQEHYKTSSMELHAHNMNGAYISGFYFLEVPEDSSNVIFHDPRPTKVFTSLQEKDYNLITPTSSHINYKPEPGMFLFTNSWLPHSFLRNRNKLPLKFIHFNVTVIPNNTQQPVPDPVVEIV